MNDNILIAALRGSLLSNNQDRNGEIDFLMNDDNYTIKNIKTDDEMFEFKKYLDDFKSNLDDKEQYHIDHYIDYLKKEYNKETRIINFDLFNPMHCFLLYKKMAMAGNGVLINSLNIMLLFLPSINKITNKQIDALNRLSIVMTEGKKVECSFGGEDSELFSSFDELTNYIKENKKKLSK